MSENMPHEELNRRVSIHIKRIELMMKRGQISNEELKYIRFDSYPISKRQWQLPPELTHLEEIYAAIKIEEPVGQMCFFHGYSEKYK